MILNYNNIIHDKLRGTKSYTKMTIQQILQTIHSLIGNNTIIFKYII